MAAEHPRTNEGRIASVTPIEEKTVGSVRTPLLVLLAAVGFTLLIACANIANMMLARAVVRRKELAIRESLGADRWRILRHLLLESLLLSGIAGVLGFALASWVVPAAAAAIPDSAVFTNAAPTGYRDPWRRDTVQPCSLLRGRTDIWHRAGAVERASGFEPRPERIEPRSDGEPRRESDKGNARGG